MLPQRLPLQIAPWITERKKTVVTVTFLATYSWFWGPVLSSSTLDICNHHPWNQNKGVLFGGKTKGGANAEMALGREFAWHAVEVEKHSHRHLIWVSKKSRTFGIPQWQHPRQEPNSIHSQEICSEEQSHWAKRSVLSWLLLHHIQELCLGHLGHQPQASWVSSEGMCTGPQSSPGPNLCVNQCSAHECSQGEETIFPILDTKEQGLNFYLTTSPYKHTIWALFHQGGQI